MSSAKSPNQSNFAVYVHIPYCLEKCPYCDFNSYGIGPQATNRQADLQEADYCEALLAELNYYRAQPEWAGRRCSSIFFGGGTPSIFSADSIGQILEALRAAFPCTTDCEVTLEANPGTLAESLGREKMQGFRAVGVTRISLGAQSFHAKKLRTLGRWHSTEDIRTSVDHIRTAGFSNFNLDLMFGVPGEGISAWKEDLQTAIALDPSHIATYGLTIEPGTEFAVQKRKGLLQLPPEEAQATMYELSQEVLADAGYAQYEISNFAQPGRECQHNLGYWQWGEYLGLGAGSHSFAKQPQSNSEAKRWSNIPKPSHYIDRANSKGDCSQLREDISAKQAEHEYLLCGLRTRDGIDAQRYQQCFGFELYKRYSQAIDRFTEQHMMERLKTGLALTRKGFLFADAVLAEFVGSLKGDDTNA